VLGAAARIKIPFTTAAVASGIYVIGKTASDTSAEWELLAGPHTRPPASLSSIPPKESPKLRINSSLPNVIL